MEIPFTVTITKEDLEPFLEDLLGKTLIPKTEFREAHYHRNMKTAISDGIEIKQIIHIKESVEVVPFPTVEFVIDYIQDKAMDRSVDYLLDVVGTYLAIKLAKLVKANLKIGEIDVPIDKNKIIKAFRDQIDRIKEKFNKK